MNTEQVKRVVSWMSMHDFSTAPILARVLGFRSIAGGRVRLKQLESVGVIRFSGRAAGVRRPARLIVLAGAGIEIARVHFGERDSFDVQRLDEDQIHAGLELQKMFLEAREMGWKVSRDEKLISIQKGGVAINLNQLHHLSKGDEVFAKMKIGEGVICTSPAAAEVLELVCPGGMIISPRNIRHKLRGLN